MIGKRRLKDTPQKVRYELFVCEQKGEEVRLERFMCPTCGFAINKKDFNAKKCHVCGQLLEWRHI